jgi:hypothetical protein
MSTSELNKSQPILRFLAPSSTNAAPLGQPTESSFNHPTPCRMLLVFGNGFRYWLTTSSAMGDMSVIVGICNNLMNILEIISLVQAQMLFAIGTGDNNRDDEVINRPFVMLIGASDMNGQGCAAFINQDVNLGAALATVGRIASGCLAAQRRGNRFAIDGLPFPANAPFPSVEAHHRLEDFAPDVLSLPGLETLVQDTAGDTEPFPMDGLPLTACPQDVPDAVDNGSIVSTWSADPPLLRLLRQVPLDTSPQWTRNSEIIDIFGLCVTLVFVHLHLVGNGFERKQFSFEVLLFSP